MHSLRFLEYVKVLGPPKGQGTGGARARNMEKSTASPVMEWQSEVRERGEVSQ